MKYDKGIPYPGRGIRGSLYNNIKDMQIGDSFLIEIKQQSHVNGISRRLKYKCRTKREGEQVRVWRLADGI